LIEDDRMIGQSVSDALRQEGSTVEWVRDGSRALQVLGNPVPAGAPDLHLDSRFDLVLLDLGLPGRDGLEVLRAIRGRKSAIPVIIVSARDGVRDRIAGLDAGADDYIVKPFEIDELAARMRAVVRRRSGRGEPVVAIGDVEYDPAARIVRRAGAPVSLSARETALLDALLVRPGAILSRAQLEDRLYGWGETIESNAVSVYVHQLRQKLGADFIRNIRGVGYYVGRPKASP
jgi:DNA-binding response OmpR family regulator